VAPSSLEEEEVLAIMCYKRTAKFRRVTELLLIARPSPPDFIGCQDVVAE
jgi:hypothetical protein